MSITSLFERSPVGVLSSALMMLFNSRNWKTEQRRVKKFVNFADRMQCSGFV